MSDDINRVRKLVEAERELAAIRQSCHHEWDESVSDPESVLVAVATGRLEQHGSDIWPEVEYKIGSKPRWSRTCKKCLIKTYSYSK